MPPESKRQPERRGARHGEHRRDAERRELEARWEENRKRREAGWPSLTGATDQYSNELCTKVRNWNRKPNKKGKAVDAKDINCDDVMEVLALASALTNDPAYTAAQKAMRLHRLDKGGLRRAFQDLLLRHGHDQVPDLGSPDTVDGHPDDVVQQYMGEFGYEFRQAVEHVVANIGMPGTSFADAVDRVRKAYPTRDQKAFAKREQREADRRQYLEELHGLRDPDDFR